MSHQFGRVVRAVRVTYFFVVVEVGLRVATLPRLCALLGLRMGESYSHEEPPVARGPAARYVHTVNRVGRIWPWEATCLRRSLVLGRMLRDLDPQLMLGVRRGESGAILAHAWLVVGGTSIDPDSSIYQTMPLV